MIYIYIYILHWCRLSGWWDHGVYIAGHRCNGIWDIDKVTAVVVWRSSNILFGGGEWSCSVSLYCCWCDGVFSSIVLVVFELCHVCEWYQDIQAFLHALDWSWQLILVAMIRLCCSTNCKCCWTCTKSVHRFATVNFPAAPLSAMQCVTSNH